MAKRYDELYPGEFEKFAIEISGRLFDKKLHGYSEGSDDGIDGIDDIHNPSLIMQAKRWNEKKSQSEAVKDLMKEIDKILKTKEKYKWNSSFKYIIVTSMDFSPKNEYEIIEYANKKLSGLIPCGKYIVFKSKLNGLLNESKYQDIFKNYGLIDKDIPEELRVDRLKKIKIESDKNIAEFNSVSYIEPDFLKDIFDIIKKEHVLFIHGTEGIGKTISCFKLCGLFDEKINKTVMVISRTMSGIKDVLALYRSGFHGENPEALLVAFDDCFGRNKLDFNEEDAKNLKELLREAKKSDNLYICLNSRTQFYLEVERNDNEIKEYLTNECVYNLESKKYSDSDRIGIVESIFERKCKTYDMNNIFLLEKYKSLKDENWKRITELDVFNPQRVEFIINNFKLTGVDFDKYDEHSQNYTNRIYRSLFRDLKDEEKYLLFSLLMFDKYPVKVGWLVRSFLFMDISPAFDIKDAFKKFDGTWLVFSVNGANIKASEYILKLQINEIAFNEDGEASNITVDFRDNNIINFLKEKSNDLYGMKGKIISKSVYLHQIIGEFVGDSALNKLGKVFFEILLSCWDKFQDRDDFESEKLVAILVLEKFEEYQSEFADLLWAFDGNWRLWEVPDGWEVVLGEIDKTKNIKIKEAFLEILEEKEFVLGMFANNHNTSMESIDEIANYINKIIKDVHQNSKTSYYASDLREFSHYKDFCDRKIELLELYIESFQLEDLLDEALNEIDKNGIEFNDLAMKMTEIAKGKVEQDIVSERYNWKDIDVEDIDSFSVLKDGIEDFCENIKMIKSYPKKK